jgi:hypothetical protein
MMMSGRESSQSSCIELLGVNMMMRAKLGLYLLAFGLTAVTTSYTASLSSPSRSAPIKHATAFRKNSVQGAGRTQLSPTQMPRDLMYGLLFREVRKLNDQANALAAQSKPNSFLVNHLRNYLQLSDSLNSQLNAVALSCDLQVEDLDKRAGAIIQTAKQQYRMVPHGRVVRVPPPPQALKDLQAQRKQTILAAADQLAGQYGPAQFAVFESLVRRYVGTHYRPPVVHH